MQEIQLRVVMKGSVTETDVAVSACEGCGSCAVPTYIQKLCGPVTSCYMVFPGKVIIHWSFVIQGKFINEFTIND